MLVCFSFDDSLQDLYQIDEHPLLSIMHSNPLAVFVNIVQVDQLVDTALCACYYVLLSTIQAM